MGLRARRCRRKYPGGSIAAGARGQAAGFTAILALALSLFVFAAADMSYQSSAGIDFTAGTGPVDPLDPDYPDTGLANLAEANVTNDSDSLSLNAAPDFVFAQADGSAFPARLTGEEYYALHSPLRPYVQVSDLRGTGGGWRLSVSASQFLKDETAPALNGAKIRLLSGTALSSNPELSPPAVNPSIIIECAGQDIYPVTVAEASGDGIGMGAWIIRWYPLDGEGRFTASEAVHESGVDLYAPPGALALPGDYSATLYWTLSDSV